MPLNGEEDSLIKKHPPKRFQRLDEQETSPPILTHEMLQNKLDEAGKRRLQVSGQRVEVLLVEKDGRLIRGWFRCFLKLIKERIESAKTLMKPGVKHPTRLVDMVCVVQCLG